MTSESSDNVDWEAAEAALSEQEIAESLRHVQGWQLSDNAIVKSFEFENFSQAIDFINEVAKVAIEHNHHPNIRLWNIAHVEIAIKTFCINGLSKLDFILASKIEDLPALKQSHPQVLSS